jgi:hypothetical protein
MEEDVSSMDVRREMNPRKDKILASVKGSTFVLTSQNKSSLYSNIVSKFYIYILL